MRPTKSTVHIIQIWMLMLIKQSLNSHYKLHRKRQKKAQIKGYKIVQTKHAHILQSSAKFKYTLRVL